MAATQSGQAIVWGVGGIATTVGIVSGTTKANFQTANYAKDSDKAYIANEDGDTVGRVDYNFKKTLRLTVVPNGTLDISDALTSLDAWTPTPGTKVTITDSKGDIDATWAGVWLLNSATQNRTNTGAVTVDLELEQFVDNNVGVATVA